MKTTALHTSSSYSDKVAIATRRQRKRELSLPLSLQASDTKNQLSFSKKLTKWNCLPAGERPMRMDPRSILLESHAPAGTSRHAIQSLGPVANAREFPRINTDKEILID
jgi:hypothetical protein